MSEMFSLKNKVVLISGATGVLGSVMAKSLAKAGAQVLILGRNKTKINELVGSIQQDSGLASGYIADVTDDEQLTQVKENIEITFGHIDVLINAAGGNMPEATIGPKQSLLDMDTEAFRKVMELNYFGSLIPIKTFLPLLIKSKTSSIINISSITAKRPLTRVLGYSSAKSAIENLTRSLAIEFANKYGAGIRVNAIAPGFFLTEQNRELLTKKDGTVSPRGEQILKNTPMNKFGEPEDLLGAVHWLCSNASQFVTGEIICVDGGFNAYSGV
jgi:NAD(P)-dependent dehydrogenase (short-subunit alcohol dehydrogenase family)